MNIINYKFLYFFLKSDIFIDHFRSFAQKAVNQASVRVSDLKTIKIPLPPLEIQQEIVVDIEEEERFVEECKKAIKKHQEKIKKVIDKVIGGTNE